MREAEVVQGDPTVPGPWDAALEGSDAVVNLAGYGIFDKRWNPEIERLIRTSRVNTTRNVVEAIGRMSRKPAVFVQSSAIGYYGPRGDEEVVETSAPGNDFMADVCVDWERAAQPVEGMGVRLVTVRTGIVLSRGESALAVMTPIFKWLPGGAAPIGNGGKLLRPAGGRQFMSWIHLDDIVGIILFAIDQTGARGPVNGTAPSPVRNAEFGRALAKVVRRPFLPIGPPDFLIQAALGGVAQVILTGQRVLPGRALSLGYTFAYPELAGALAQIFGQSASASPKPEVADATR
jgi:uncharacterized protein (TIGR01777 family)